MKQFFLLIVMFTLSIGGFSQNTPAHDINTLLGRGINMGNAFEAPTESGWGNPWKPEYFEDIAELGFDHVRIPISWETDERSLKTAPYTIKETFLEQIEVVVNKAIDEGLIAVINMHHHKEFIADPYGQKDRFLAMWEQIAEKFKDFPNDKLLFEVMNEPTDALTPEIWNDMFAEGLSVIRESNPNRTVFLGVAEFGGLSGVPKLIFPEDDNIILSIHYYNPFQFTHQGADWNAPDSYDWLGTKWNDTEAERNAIINEFAQAISIAKDNNIPINIGEFGALNTADMASRAKWTTFLARWFEEQEFSWTYWEYSAAFGIYNPNTKEFYQELVDALLNNEMPESAKVDKTAIYDSDFNSGVDGWSLNTTNGAKGTIFVEEGKLLLDITSKGSDGWHTQATKNNINLVKDKNYQVTITARASKNYNCTSYIGENKDPWSAYSDYNSITFTPAEKDFLYSFKMTRASDSQARLVFDLGMDSGRVDISKIKVEEVSLSSISSPSSSMIVSLWPNPANEIVYLSSNKNIKRIELFNLTGTYQENIVLIDSQINVSSLAKGLFFVKISFEDNSHEVHKIFIY